MDGFVIVNKPYGMTSRQLVSKVSRLTQKKAGHTGTLDPLATGMMVIALGDATKFSRWITSNDKAYTATIQFGSQTSTDDREGEVISSSNLTPTKQQLESELQKLSGPIKQTPPNFSAIHLNGVRAYKKARKGDSFTLPEREVVIHDISLKEYNAEERSATVYIHCQSGTYIRSIARDIGVNLKCFAHLSDLNRLWVSPFNKHIIHDLDDAIDEQNITTLDSFFKQQAHVILSRDQALAIGNGLQITIERNVEHELAAFYKDTFIGMLQPIDKQYYRSIRLRKDVIQIINASDSL